MRVKSWSRWKMAEMKAWAGSTRVVELVNWRPRSYIGNFLEREGETRRIADVDTLRNMYLAKEERDLTTVLLVSDFDLSPVKWGQNCFHLFLIFAFASMLVISSQRAKLFDKFQRFLACLLLRLCHARVWMFRRDRSPTMQTCRISFTFTSAILRV